MKTPETSHALSQLEVEIDRWQKVICGLHLIYVSVFAALWMLLLLFVLIGCAWLACNVEPGLSVFVHPQQLGWPVYVACVVFAGVCAVFATLGLSTCCAAPLSSGAKKWLVISWFLSVGTVVLLGVKTADDAVHRTAILPNLRSLSANQIRYQTGFSVIGLSMIASTAHLLFVIGLIQINKSMGKHGLSIAGASCFMSDSIMLAISLAWFAIYVNGSTKRQMATTVEDVIVACIIVGLPVCIVLVSLPAFLVLLRHTHNNVAWGMAHRKGPPRLPQIAAVDRGLTDASSPPVHRANTPTR
jgi:hypothetical protein